MRSRQYVEYRLYGADLDPDRVTASTGILPRATWRTGDLVHPEAILRHKVNGWAVRSKVDQGAELVAHFESVLEQLRPGWDALVELGTQHWAVFECVLKVYEAQGPELYLSSNILGFVTQLHADIGFDLYCLPETHQSAR